MNTNNGTLIWITGLAGSGKTTIGNRLYYRLKESTDAVVLLDGDILKEIVDDRVGYSFEERKKRAYKYANLCKKLVDQGLVVICCTIAMFEEVRKKNRVENRDYIEVFLDVPVIELQKRDKNGLYNKYRENENVAGINTEVEFPQNPDIVLNSYGSTTIKECVDIIDDFYKKIKSSPKRDVLYWNNYYNSNVASESETLFAREVIKYIKPGLNLLDVGCGNGRDSLFFIKKGGVNVTGVDLSNAAIEELQRKAVDYPNSAFICDDFSLSNVIYKEQFDYIYSRFSLHAINKFQEKYFLKKTYESLKENGLLFIEARSINDNLCGLGEKVGVNEYIYNDHYRRFIEKEELVHQLIDLGYRIIYSVEGIDMAPFGNENPSVVRVVAEKIV